MRVPLRLSKKWLCHFFEKEPLRSAPQLSADSGQFDAHSAQSVFCHAHVAAENKLYCFRVCGRETLRGFFYMLDAPGRMAGGINRLSKNPCCKVKRQSSGGACGGKARLKSDKPPQKGLMCQGFRAKRHFERFQNARRISAVKKVSRTFLTS